MFRRKTASVPKPSNPVYSPVILCHSCLRWNSLEAHNLNISEPAKNITIVESYAGVDQLCLSVKCEVCTLLLNAYHVGRTQHAHVQAAPSSCLVLNIRGPYYLEHRWASSRVSQLPDITSEPGFKIIKIFLEVNVIKWDQASKVPVGSFEHPWLSSPEDNTNTPRAVVPPGLQKAPVLFRITPQLKMVYSTTRQPFLCRVEACEVPYLNLDILKGWLRQCERDHRGRCLGIGKEKQGFAAKFRYKMKLRNRDNRLSSTKSLPRGFRVINTKEWMVMQPKHRIRYVALSYLWNNGAGCDAQLETSNIASLELPGGLRNFQVPNVIKDAISLCQQLNETYIWIDRFCIIQDDLEKKTEQIRAMDKIYSLASFTLVLALNTRSPTGLPGFTGHPRSCVSSALSSCLETDTECQALINGSQQFIDNLVNSSLWNKRGWTFQERLLSSRILYITDVQAIFECSVKRGLEILTWELPMINDNQGRGSYRTTQNLFRRLKIRKSKVIARRDEVPYLVDNENLSKISFKVGQNTSLTDYYLWVKDFTLRQLSFEADILHAFHGVANALSPLFGNCPMLFGLPEKHLDDCLRWCTRKIPSRRAGVLHIPSWSWASSLEPVEYEYYTDPKASIVIFHYQDPDLGRLRMLDIETRWIRHRASIQSLANQNEIPELTGTRWIPSDTKTQSYWEQCPHNHWQAVARQESLDPDACAVAAKRPRSLVFNTTVASLKIDLRDSGGDELFHQYYNSNHHAVLCTMNNVPVGKVFLSCLDWIKSQRNAKDNTGLIDAVVISGGLEPKRIRRDDENCPSSHFWLLNVILVERLQDKPLVAQRLAFGTVTMSKWRECNPRWETVVLC